MTIHQGEEQMLTRLAALSEVGAAGHVGPGEVVGPVDDVQHPEHRGEHDPEEGGQFLNVVNQNSQYSAKVPTKPATKHLLLF